MAKRTPDRSRSLAELAPEECGGGEYDSYLVRTCLRLQSKPLSEFCTEDLRIMIGTTSATSMSNRTGT